MDHTGSPKPLASSTTSSRPCQDDRSSASGAAAVENPASVTGTYVLLVVLIRIIV